MSRELEIITDIARRAGEIHLKYFGGKLNVDYKMDQFDPFTIGTDHIAIACETEEELNRLANGLSDAGVENTGVKLDPVLQKLYVAFKDPDRIQWEFYMI